MSQRLNTVRTRDPCRQRNSACTGGAFVVAVNNRNLRDRLQELKQRSLALSDALTRAASELQGQGIDPTVELIEQIQVYRAQFSQLQRDLLPTADYSTPQTLAALEAALNTGETRTQLLNTLRQYECLIVTGTGTADAARDQILAPVWSACEILHAELAQPGLPSTPGLQTLLAGRHPLQALWRLVTEPDSIADDDWLQAQEHITAEYGRELATAVIRGRIGLRPAVTTTDATSAAALIVTR